MNLERISDALQGYTGQEESMHEVVSVLQEELGEDWTQTVFQDLQGLPPALKNNLTQVFNYYAATIAWNETQGYLVDPDLQRTPELEERLPILKHWLSFFGAQGDEAYQKLENYLSEKSTPEESPEAVEDEFEDISDGEKEEEVDALDDGAEPQGDEDASAEEEVQNEEQEAQDVQDDGENVGEEILETQEENSPEDVLEEEQPEEEEALPKEEKNTDEHGEDDPIYFDIKKISSQLALLAQNQAWLSARCVELKGIEVYAYPFYGFIVDLMRQILKGMEAILENENAASLIEDAFAGGQSAFNRSKEAIEHDIELAEQNCESATTALISDDVDMDAVKRTLGTIDTSDNVEYVGPAPDGFELLDEETPLDESAIKEQYEKIENMDALTGQQADSSSQEETENASQNEQKGVQRKLSFSLKKKNSTGSDT